MSPHVPSSLRTLLPCHSDLTSDRQPAQLLQVLDRVDEQARREEHEQRADDREEPAQVHPMTELVDHEGDHERDGQPDDGAEQASC